MLCAAATTTSVASGDTYVHDCTVVPSLQQPSPRFCDESNSSSVEIGVDAVLMDNVLLDNGSSSSSSDNSTSFWDLAVTIYLPILLVWFRRSLFGSAHLFRSIIVGQVLRLLVTGSMSEWMTDRAPSWLLWMMEPPPAIALAAGGGTSLIAGGKHHAAATTIDPHAWPPPARTARALRPLFTLVVHPDGLTWVMLRKLRYGPGPGFSFIRS
jgi:hypothetical protein